MKTAIVFVIKIAFLGSAVVLSVLAFDIVLCFVGSLLSSASFLSIIRSDASHVIMFIGTVILSIAALIRLAMLEEEHTRLAKNKELAQRS